MVTAINAKRTSSTNQKVPLRKMDCERSWELFNRKRYVLIEEKLPPIENNDGYLAVAKGVAQSVRI